VVAANLRLVCQPIKFWLFYQQNKARCAYKWFKQSNLTKQIVLVNTCTPVALNIFTLTSVYTTGGESTRAGLLWFIHNFHEWNVAIQTRRKAMHNKTYIYFGIQKVHLRCIFSVLQTGNGKATNVLQTLVFLSGTLLSPLSFVFHITCPGLGVAHAGYTKGFLGTSYLRLILRSLLVSCKRGRGQTCN
jgi:hypothetical protein